MSEDYKKRGLPSPGFRWQPSRGIATGSFGGKTAGIGSGQVRRTTPKVCGRLTGKADRAAALLFRYRPGTGNPRPVAFILHSHSPLQAA